MKSVAEELAQKWGRTIEDSMDEALADWIGASSASARHMNRTRASYLWDCAIARLRAALAFSTDFFFQDVGQTTYIIYRGQLRLQVKGLNRRGRTSSAPTGRVSRFVSQLPLDLEDRMDLTNVYLTYQLDPYETTIQSISLACPQGRVYKWLVPVDSEAKVADDLFAGTGAERTSTTGGRLRLKVLKDAEAEDGAV